MLSEHHFAAFFEFQKRSMIDFHLISYVMARTKATARRWLENADRIKRKKKLGQQTDTKQFEYFDQLPLDTKLEIFKHLPFYYWATALSCVCKDWSALLRTTRCKKILKAEDFYYHGHKRDFIVNVARSFQVTDLIMGGYAMNHNYEPCVSDAIDALLLASNELVYVDLLPFGSDDNLSALKLPFIPPSVKNLSISFWSMVEGKDLPNLTHLQVPDDIFPEEEIDQLYFPMLQELRTDNFDSSSDLSDLLVNIKKMVPNLKKFYFGIGVDARRIDEEDYIELEQLATSLGFDLYCRNLRRLIGCDFGHFVELFEKQKIPYSYYSTTMQSLLSYACSDNDIRVVRYLLENGYTTMKYELELSLNECNPTLLVGTTDVILEYLLQHPEYHPEDYTGAAYFVNSLVDKELKKQLFKNRKFDLLEDVDRVPLIHHLSQHWLSVLNYQMESFSQDQIFALISCKDYVGNTPLHFSVGAGNLKITKHLMKLGASLSELNQKGQSPLSLLTARSSDTDAQIELLEMVPVIPMDCVQTCLKSIPDNVEVLHYLVKKRGVDLNAVIDGRPLIWEIKWLPEVNKEDLDTLKELGVNFNIMDDQKHTLLFHKIELSTEYMTFLVNEIGLDINHVASDGLTPLTFALDEDFDINQIDDLISLGAKVSKEDQVQAWKRMIAVAKRIISDEYLGEAPALVLLKLIALVLETGINVNEPIEKNGTTRLMKLCLIFDNDSIETDIIDQLIALLLKFGGDLNARDTNGNTLAHLIQNAHMLECLVQRGLDPHAMKL